MNADLLNLSWQVQVALASGCSAYLLAYFGLRHSHKQIDTFFTTLFFSLMASGVISALDGREGFESPVLQGTVAFITTSAAAVVWRKWGSRFLSIILRFTNMSWSDNDSSALITLTSSTDHFVSQIAVQLDDGTWLRCDDTSRFKGAAFYPCLIGPAGDVAFYLTHEELVGQKAKELLSVRDQHYGDRITYIPAQRIKQITVRHVGKISHS